MPAHGYWDRIVRSRVARRRVLLGGASAAAGLGALSIIGCGEDDDTGSTGATGPTGTGTGTTGAGTGATTGSTGSTGGAATGSTGATSGLVDTPVDTTSQARPGGVLKDYQAQDVRNFDAATSNSTAVVNVGSVFAYPRMLKYVEAKYPDQATGDSEGELAESYEISPDKLTLTFKLRQNMTWDPRQPTNGRAADAQDVLTTWARFLELHPGAGDMASQRASSASIESAEAPDDQTVVFRLSKPDSAIIPLFTAWDHLYVMPREADGGFDPNTEVRGHGPYMLEEFVPSARVVWTKAPNYYQKDRPFFDKIERPLITDYSQLLAQFLTGAVWTTVVQQEDVVSTKTDKPETLLLQNAAYDHAAGPYISFGFEGDSVFKDKRLRQALSMSIDGESYANAIDNRDKFEAEGLDFPIAYNSVVPAGWMPFWLDPQDAEAFGPSHAYLQYNPDEAKKLIDAAGYDGRPLDFFYNSENNYGPIYAKIVQIMGGMFSNVGFNINYQPFVYRTFYDEYFLAYVQGRKEQPGFNGLMLRAGRGHASIAAQLFGGLHPDGSTFHGFSADGNNAIDGDPEVTAFVENLRLEYDQQGQIDIVNDLIRYYTDQSYSVTRPTNAKEFAIYWPVVGNAGVYNSFRGGNIQAEVNIHWWLDDTKPPLA